MIKNISFPMKIWALTVFTSPIVLIVVLYFTRALDKDPVVVIGGVWMMIFFGYLFSIPALILCRVFYKALLDSPISLRSKKILFATATTVWIFVTMAFVDSSLLRNFSQEFYFPLVYSVVMVISAWRFRFDPADP